MRFLLHYPLAILFHVSLTCAQHNGGFINTMPRCWQSCFQSAFPACHDQLASDAALDCLCTKATDSAFTSLVTCVTRGCDAVANPVALVAPLQAWQTACEISGHPLLRNAVQNVVGAGQTILAIKPRSTMGVASDAAASTRPSSIIFTASSSTHPISNIGGPVSQTPIEEASAASAASATSTSETHTSDSSEGSPLDVSNQAAKERARSMLGLTVCILAGVAWF